jgi:hypothetical protein
MNAIKTTKRGRGRPPEAEPGSISVSVRLGSEELAQVDGLANSLMPGVRLARHEVVRSAFVRGLEAMQREAASK